ncbi:MAG: 16S rRNA (uracil(1498)-N(3))-methyltransferase [Holosporaceae bacterium]|nr:16S rRNA (uracil(1498)-N(3))-methyltransferase [Holosporaceae bacterium]
MKHIPRFYSEADLGENISVALSLEQMHHASNVLRLSSGDLVRVFNSQFGEWNCKIVDVKKRLVECTSLFHESRIEKGPIVACSLINPKRFDFFLEKVTELGVSEIIPIISQYTQYRELNLQKALQKIILACEQSRQFNIPVLREITKIEDFLKKYTLNYQVLVGDEKCCNEKLRDIILEKSAFLIGPEGGFSDEEYILFAEYNNLKKFSFGNNILRTETAAIAFVSAWKSCFF